MSPLNFTYSLTFHTDTPRAESMNSQSHWLIKSEALQAMEETENERCITRKDDDPSVYILNKIEAVTLDINDMFYRLINTVQKRERVDLEEFRDANAVQDEAEAFASLKSSIAERDALFDDLKNLHEPPKTVSPPIILTMLAPHDPKDGFEPANHFTQPAMRMVKLMLKEERFQPIQSELETIFDLMGLQASRHSEIKLEEEKRILNLGLDLAERERDLAAAKKKLSASRKELGTANKELAALKEDTAEKNVYIEDLNEKMKEQEGEKTAWEWEKNGAADEKAELQQQIDAMLGTPAELHKEQAKVELLETTVRIMENASRPKDVEILQLKKNLAIKEKQVFQYKKTAIAREEEVKVLSKELRGNEEHIAGLSQELGEKEYEIRLLKSNHQAQSNGSRQSPLRRSSATETTLLRRVEDMQRDYTQLKNSNQGFRDKNIENEVAIKCLKRQLDLKDVENKQLQTQVNGLSRLTNQATDALFRERR